MSLQIFNRLVQTSGTVECDRDLKLGGDLSKVLGLHTNVTVLKVKVKVRVWNFVGQLKHCCRLTLISTVICTVDVVIECD